MIKKMSKKRTLEEINDILKPKNIIILERLENCKGRFKCLYCDHIWSTEANHLQDIGCNDCRTSGRTSLRKLQYQYNTSTIRLIDRVVNNGRNSKSRGIFYCFDCGSTWTKRLEAIKPSGITCNICKKIGLSQTIIVGGEEANYYDVNIIVNGVLKPQKEYIKRRAKQCAAVKYKGGKCEDCGLDLVTNYWCAHFHHIDPAQKDFTIGELYQKRWHHLKEEVKKCVLLCSNCHNKRHCDIERQDQCREVIKSLADDILDFDSNPEDHIKVKEAYTIERNLLKAKSLP
jgi:hypothetical protein